MRRIGPREDVLMRMLLAPRADKAAERLVVNAYRRAIQGFDRNDATVTMMPTLSARDGSLAGTACCGWTRVA